jgi:SNF2 family DNA or RNA helicase
MAQTKREPLGHQRVALRWARPRAAIALFMQMRLGKTLVAIRWAEGRPAPFHRVLVVGPLSVLPGWQEELALEGVRSTVLEGDLKHRVRMLARGRVRWYLTNYEALFERGQRTPRGKPKAVPSPIALFPWDCVILDESTRIRNPKAITTKVCLGWLAKAEHRAVLSGLPAPEGPIDFFEQMRFIHGRWMGCVNAYAWRYRYYVRGGFKWEPKLETWALTRHAVRRDAFCLTRKQAGLGSRKIHERRYVALPPKLRKQYDRIESEFAYAENYTKWILEARTWMARLAGGFPKEKRLWSQHKNRELLDLLQGELAHSPVVVWFRFNRELRQAKVFLQKAGVPCVAVTGRTPLRVRARRKARWVRGDARAFLVQIKCGRFGLDLSYADTAIYYSNGYSYEDRDQSEDRIVHPKKRRPLLYVDLVSQDTVDEDVLSALKHKRKAASFFAKRAYEAFQQRRAKHGKKV